MTAATLSNRKTSQSNIKRWATQFRLHLHIAWRLLCDPRVSLPLKLVTMVPATVYAMLPLPDDAIPLIGWLDDALLLLVSTFIFYALTPAALKNEHKSKLTNNGWVSEAHPHIEHLRDSQELKALSWGFGIYLAMVMLTGYVGYVLTAFIVMGMIAVRLMTASLRSNTVRVSATQFPQVYAALRRAQAELPATSVELFVQQDQDINAYVYGYNAPYTIVLTSEAVEKLSPAELQAIIAHELGHILFGHVKLTGLFGGLGRTSWLSSILRMIFLRWSRRCEYSADAVAWLASGKDVRPMVHALLKTSCGLDLDTINVREYLQQLDDAAVSRLTEVTNTHPHIAKRVQALLALHQAEFGTTEVTLG